jgi:hypothetical protein
VIQTLQCLSVSSNHFAFCSDSNFEMAQCGVKSSTIWSDYICIASSCNASSHFTYTLLTRSHTTIMNMPRYLIPAWNERPFCRCHQRAKFTTSLELSTYERRCWVCPDSNPCGVVGLSIFIS